MRKFSFFKQTIYIVLMANVFFDYVLLHSLCLLHFLFLCFHRIHIRAQTDKLFYNCPVQLVLHFTDYFFAFTIVEWTFFLVPRKIEQMFTSIKVFLHVTHLNLICEGICIGKYQRRDWVLSLDVIIVEIIHKRF